MSDSECEVVPQDKPIEKKVRKSVKKVEEVEKVKEAVQVEKTKVQVKLPVISKKGSVAKAVKKIEEVESVLDKPYCEYCEKSFTSNAGLSKHKKTARHISKSA